LGAPAPPPPPPATGSGDRFDALVVGDLNPDLLVRGEEIPIGGGQLERDADVQLVLGGSAAIAAAGMARLGLRATLCAVVGNDLFGAASRRMLSERGVSEAALRIVPASRTGLSVHLLAREDRAIWTERGAMTALRAADAIDAIARLRPGHVHLASIFLLPAIAHDGGAIVAAAHAAGATVSADTNFDPADRFERPPWLTRADLLLPNAVEALRLTGRAEARIDDDTAVEAAALELADGGALVAIKQGARGAVAVRRSGAGRAAAGVDGEQLAERDRAGVERARISLPAGRLPFADAVGAGDSFEAGMVRALLDGRPLRDALAYACAAGTLSTRAAGGTAAQATHAEAERLAQELLRG
jgi:sugar/nucleoside kinase (ribokinase family)